MRNHIGSEQSGKYEGVTGGAENLPALDHPAAVRFQIGTMSMQVDRAIGTDAHAAIGMRQIFALRIPIDAAFG